MNRTLSLLSLAFLSCAHKPAPTPEVAAAPAPSPAPLPAYAQALVGDLDTSVSPCEDFYQYACGGWLKKTELPADKPIWVRSFSTINDTNLASMHTMLEDAVKSPGTEPERTRLAAYYGSCMDEPTSNAAGLTPLAPLFKDIDGVKDVKSFMTMSGRLSTMGVTSVLKWDVDSDFKDPSLLDLYIMQDGLSLPDRDYYLKTDDSSKALVAALQAQIASTLVRTGMAAEKAEKQAALVVAFETALAGASVPKAELRDLEKIYNKVDKAGLLKSAPKLGFDLWLANLGAAGINDLVSTTPEVFKKFEGVLAKTDAATLRAYLKWQTVHGFAGALDSETYQADFDLFGKKVVGQAEPETRWKRCVRSTNGALGEALGKVWIQTNFPGNSKDIARSMIANIEDAFKVGLPRLAWMDDATRERAKEKADALVNKVGYPDKWRDYTALELTPSSYATNVMAARRFESTRVIGKVGKPVDKSEWFMSPPTVNAYYNPPWNEMVFPAGILQPPFFQHDYPAAMNYGAIGSVMGHELSHGFDDEGRKFDGSGRMVEWWAPEVSQRFDERASCVKDQFDAYEVAPGLNVKGDLTLGENIADLGGSRIAYRAFKTHLAEGKKADIPGFTDEQVYFISYAQNWCGVSSPEFEKMLVLSNPHSPGKYRVIGPLSNLAEFHQAFNCAEGTKMHPAKTCEVW